MSGALRAETDSSAGPFQPNFFLKIFENGTVEYSFTKHEMGQGTMTGLTVIIADELGIAPEQIKVTSVYDPKYGRELQGSTGGSATTIRMWNPLREAGAAARFCLIQAAAANWKVNAADCDTVDGKVVHKKSGREMGFGSLVGAASQVSLPEEVPLRDPSTYRYISKGHLNLRGPDMVSGKEMFGIDVQVPGMLYAVIERCPVLEGELVSFDDSAARAMKGVHEVFGWHKFTHENGDEGDKMPGRAGVAVVADSTWTAMKARERLKVTWDRGSRSGKSHEDQLTAMGTALDGNEGRVFRERGDVDGLFKRASKIIRAEYRSGYQAHALMEPLNAVADIKPGSAEIWIANQMPRWSILEVAHLAGIPSKDVKAHLLVSGGGFGRRFQPDFAVEAARISKHMGKPVKVTWTREDEIQCDSYHPLQRTRLQCAFDENDTPRAVQIDSAVEVDWQAFSWLPYAFEGKRYREFILDPLLTTGAWRSVGAHLGAFGSESFIDEIVHELEEDPLDFRLKWIDQGGKYHNDHLDLYRYGEGDEQERNNLMAVLKTAAEKAGWGRKKTENRGLGLALFRFRKGLCAQVADVSVNGDKLTIHKITVAVHCGRVVNPTAAENQVVGGVIWSLSGLLFGGVEVADGAATRGNFHDNRILRISEIPPIEVHFLPSEEPPNSIGETAVPPLSPAICNAIFAASGKRIREMPIPYTLA